MNHPVSHWNTWHALIFLFHTISVFKPCVQDTSWPYFGGSSGRTPGWCPHISQVCTEHCSKVQREKRCWETFLCNSPSANHTQNPHRSISEREVLTQDSCRAPALFPSGRFKGILLQGTSSTITLFYRDNKIKFMQLWLIWHIFLSLLPL